MRFTIGLGIVILLFLAFSICRAMDTYRWFETPCTFEKVATQNNDDGGLDRYIVYSYTLDGQTYISDKMYIDLFIDGRGINSEIEEKYNNKKPGICYVNPLFHSDAVLLKGNQTPIGFYILFGFMGFVIITKGLSDIFKDKEVMKNKIVVLRD